MIKVTNEDVEIRGNGLDVIQEFCGLLNAIRIQQPEMIAGVLGAWSEIFSNNLNSIDKDMAQKICTIAEDWLELNEVK